MVENWPLHTLDATGIAIADAPRKGAFPLWNKPK
jgi:hypothetical protein